MSANVIRWKTSCLFEFQRWHNIIRRDVKWKAGIQYGKVEQEAWKVVVHINAGKTQLRTIGSVKESCYQGNMISKDGIGVTKKSKPDWGRQIQNTTFGIQSLNPEDLR